MAKAVGVPLDNHHRAVDDAACTAEIFVKFIDMLEQMGIVDLEQLNAEGSTSVSNIMKMPTYHAIILATCDQGRTNLYNLISLLMSSSLDLGLLKSSAAVLQESFCRWHF